MGLKWPKAKLLPQTIKVRYVHYRGRNVQIAHLLFLKSARFYLAKVYVMQKVFLQKCLTHRIQQQINKLHKSELSRIFYQLGQFLHFFYYYWLCRQEQSDWLTISWKFRILSFKIGCWIWWTKYIKARIPSF